MTKKQAITKINKHQQPSFKFETNMATYDCIYQDSIEGSERWEVTVDYKSYDNLSAVFYAPIKWSREFLFRWLSDMELSEC